MKTRKTRKPNHVALIEAGFFDGRFKSQVIGDKKKKLNKNICRKRIEI